MLWYLFFFLSLSILASALFIILASFFSNNKIKRQVNPLQLLFASCFMMAMLLCIPPLSAAHAEETAGGIKTFVMAFQNAIRVFGAEEMDDAILDHISLAPGWLKEWYTFITLGVQFLAPLLTFSFVISFFRNLLPYCRFKLFFWREAHIFSELNEKTLALAKSIVRQKYNGVGGKRKSKPLIVFTGVCKEDEEGNNDLLANALKMDALVFKTDLETIHFRSNFWKRNLNFYLISENENEIIRHATTIIKSYDSSEVSMYVFSDGIECEMLMSAWDNRNMRIYRINDAQALIYHNLSLHGVRLFRNACENNGKTVSAIIVGMGKYGYEMLKALIWYGQVAGFHLKINVFDADPAAESVFSMDCPEIMKMNGSRIEGEAQYDITIHSGMDARGALFLKKIEKIPDATYVFVALGSDEENIVVSSGLRAVYERMNPNYKPDIETVVYDTNISSEMSVAWEGDPVRSNDGEGIKNARKQPYNLHMIGDLESFYSVDTVINSSLIESGLEVNLRWAKLTDPNNIREDEKKFWRYDYNYRSSIAKALHEDLRKKLIELGYIDEIPGVYKDWDKRTEDEKLAIGSFEHIRWNAYMRTEGYQYGEKRNDLAKQHHNLVPVNALSDEDLRKDA